MIENEGLELLITGVVAGDAGLVAGGAPSVLAHIVPGSLRSWSWRGVGQKPEAPAVETEHAVIDVADQCGGSEDLGSALRQNVPAKQKNVTQ